MNFRQFDPNNLFDSNLFVVDRHLIRSLRLLHSELEKRYRCKLIQVIVDGARTVEFNKELYQNKYGKEWKNYYSANNLHVIQENTGAILRAVDVAYEKENKERIKGQELYRVIQDLYLFSNIGIADTYVHVDTFVRVWRYK